MSVVHPIAESEFLTLTQLEAQVGQAAIARLLTSHRQNVSDTVASLTAQAQSMSMDELHMVAHRMKGSCGSLGFHAFAALFEALDQAATQHDRAQVVACIARISAYHAALAEALALRYPAP